MIALVFVLVVGIFTIVACLGIAWLIVAIASRLFPCQCDRCGGHYVLGHLDRHFAKGCTPETRSLWNRRG